MQKLKPIGGVQVLATLFGVTPREIQLLAKDGIVIKVRHGAYDVPGSIAKYITYLKDRQAKNSEPDELDRERIRLTRAKADEAEIRAEMIKGNAGDMGLLMGIWANRVSQVKVKLSAIPASLAGQLATEPDPNLIRSLLESTIDDALHQLAESVQEELIRQFIEENGADVGPAAEVDGEPVG